MSTANSFENQKNLKKVVTRVTTWGNDFKDMGNNPTTTDLIPLNKKTELWLSASEVVTLLGISKKNFHKNRKNGKYVFRIIEKDGRKPCQVLLSSLPPEAQAKYLQNIIPPDRMYSAIHPVEHGGGMAATGLQRGQAPCASCEATPNGLLPPALFNNFQPQPVVVTHYTEQGSVTTAGPQKGQAPYASCEATPDRLHLPASFNFDSISEVTQSAGSCQGPVAPVHITQGHPQTNAPVSFGMIANEPQGDLSPTLTGQATPLPYTEDAKMIALARFDLLKIWEDFRDNYDCNNNLDQEKIAAKKMRNCENTQKLAPILILLKSIKIESCEIQKLLNLAESTVRNRINSGDYKYEKMKSRGRGGEKYLIYVSSLSVEDQIRYYYDVYLKEPRQLTVNEIATSPSAPRNDHKVRKTQIDNEFITLYQAKYWPHLYKIIGEVTIKTLYRWKSKIKSNNDYHYLIPEYNYKSANRYKTTLSVYEQQLYLGLLLNPVRFDCGKAYKWIRLKLLKEGYKEEEIKSYATYKRFADHFKKHHYDQWVLAREGQKNLREKCIPSLTREQEKIMPGQMLVADGHTLDFKIINPFTGKPCRATVVPYSDFRTNGIPGFEIMVTENTQCVNSALRNAILTMGKIPEYVYLDNGKSFRNKFFEGDKKAEDISDELRIGTYARLGIQTIFAKPFNARAKKIERIFEEFTSSGAKSISSYVGNNIANKPAYMKMNEKLHKALHNEYIPTMQEAIIFVQFWIDEYWHKQPCPTMKGYSIGEALNLGKGHGVDPEMLDELMMAQKTASIRANGIQFLNNMYWSEALYGRRDRVLIRYSLHDLSFIKVYSMSNEYICTAETELKYHPAAHYYGEATDKKRLEEGIKMQKRLEKATKQTLYGKEIKKQQDRLDWSKTVQIGPAMGVITPQKDVKKQKTTPTEPPAQAEERDLLLIEFDNLVKAGRIDITRYGKETK